MQLIICMPIGRYSSDFPSIRKTSSSSLSRIVDEQRNTILADCDDDGETGASSRMLHLMDVSFLFFENRSKPRERD